MGNSVEESINVIIQNQEIGPSGEFSYALSRAKVANMKRLRPATKVKAYPNLYNE
jgi:hypothetical protein